MTHITTISPKGEAALVAEEGEVLRAYRCPAGFWTIGVGLTAASGVVTPKSGMTITREESRRLLRLALERNYAPRVVAALRPTVQHVFDGAISFDFNTGGIARATWVGHYLAGRVSEAAKSFSSWTRAAGKVLPGLVARRAREWAMITRGAYPATGGQSPTISDPMTHRPELNALGYDSLPLDAAVRAFQSDRGLTVDGIVGPATRAALQRALEERAANRATISGGAVGGATGGAAEVSSAPAGAEAIAPDLAVWVLGGALALAAVVFLASLAWRYRGPLFGWLPEPAKDALAGLGIVVGRRIPT